MLDLFSKVWARILQWKISSQHCCKSCQNWVFSRVQQSGIYAGILLGWMSGLSHRGLHHNRVPVYTALRGCVYSVKIHKPICSLWPLCQTKLHENVHNFSVVPFTQVDAVLGAKADCISLKEGMTGAWLWLPEVFPLSTCPAVWAVSQSVSYHHSHITTPNLQGLVALCYLFGFWSRPVLRHGGCGLPTEAAMPCFPSALRDRGRWEKCCVPGIFPKKMHLSQKERRWGRHLCL